MPATPNQLLALKSALRAPGAVASPTPTPPRVSPTALLLLARRAARLRPEPVTLPVDLAAALVARFESLASSVLQGLSGIYHDQAGDKAVAPYLVFKLSSASIELITSDSQWDDTRVRFEVLAGSQAQANRLRDAVASQGGFGGWAGAFQAGAMSPMVRVDRNEAKERGRTVAGQYLFKAVASYQTRVRLDS